MKDRIKHKQKTREQKMKMNKLRKQKSKTQPINIKQTAIYVKSIMSSIAVRENWR